MNEERLNFAIDSETCKKSGKRGASSDQQIMHKPQHALKRPISEVCGIGDQVLSKFNKQGVISLDSWMDIQANSGEIGLEKSNLKPNERDSKFPSIVESRSLNEESKKISIIGEITTSNINTPQSDTGGNVAHIGEFKGIQKFTLPDTVTLPGPSFTSKNISHSNLCAETGTMISPSKLQTVEKKPAIPSDSKHKEISELFEIGEGRYMFKCCICNYSTENYEELENHMSNHALNPFYCNACKGCYSDESLHRNQRKCDVCDKNFVCKAQLEDHYLSHEDHHKKVCRVCHNEIVKHILKEKGRKVYKCCEPSCSFESEDVSQFRHHLYKHSDLRVFKCSQCGTRFTHSSNLCRHLRTPESCYENEFI